MSGRRPTVALVDDITVIRAGFAQEVPNLEVVAVYGRVDQLLAELPAVDVVVLDLKLAHEGQPAAAEGVRAVTAVVAGGYRVCMYTAEERRLVLAACIAAGARGLARKSDTMARTQTIIEQVAAGEVVLSQSLIALAEVLVRRRRLTLLSPRQNDVLAGRARGQTFAEIGAVHHLTEATVRGYWQDITMAVAKYLADASAADIEQALGQAPGDLNAYWPNRRA